MALFVIIWVVVMGIIVVMLALEVQQFYQTLWGQAMGLSTDVRLEIRRLRELVAPEFLEPMNCTDLVSDGRCRN
jgi:hypothetical protein